MHRRYFKSFSVLGLLSLLVAAQGLAQPPQQPRRLAPGILTEIPSDLQPGATFNGPVPLKHLPTVDFTPHFTTKQQTLFEQAKQVTFRRPVWELDFAFKPLRMAVASIPQASGKLERKPVLYMVYRIRNMGRALQQAKQPDGSYKTETANGSSLSGHPTAQRFIPHFVLTGWVHDSTTGKYEKREYLDRVIPGALRTILDREIIPPAKPMLTDEEGKSVLGPDGQPLILLNSGQISQVNPIPVTTDTDDNSVWGVVTWEDIDPRIDFLTIQVQGLTNAFRYSESVDGKSQFTQKTLQLNWWRPGDSFDEASDRIYYGVPLVKDQRKQVEILGLYDVPGPAVSVYETVDVADPPAPIPASQTTGPASGEMTNLGRHLFDMELPVDSRLQVPDQQLLDDPGTLTPALVKKFAGVGIAIPPNEKLTVETPKQIWSFGAMVDGRKRFFRIYYDPKLWDIYQEEVEFRGRVEHFWAYR